MFELEIETETALSATQERKTSDLQGKNSHLWAAWEIYSLIFLKELPPEARGFIFSHPSSCLCSSLSVVFLSNICVRGLGISPSSYR